MPREATLDLLPDLTYRPKREFACNFLLREIFTSQKQGRRQHCTFPESAITKINYIGFKQSVIEIIESYEFRLEAAVLFI